MKQFEKDSTFTRYAQAPFSVLESGLSPNAKLLLIWLIDRIRMSQAHDQYIDAQGMPFVWAKQETITDKAREALTAVAGSSKKDSDTSGSTSTVSTPTPTMVWIPTNGGTKYHDKSTCSNMKNPQQVALSEAKRLGFDPCGRCHPPE